jgi:hypothetical protein
MNILVDVFKELLGMFLSDAMLTAAILFLVAVVGGLVAARIDPAVAGGVLLVGCLAIVSGVTRREARRRAS